VGRADGFPVASARGRRRARLGAGRHLAAADGRGAEGSRADRFRCARDRPRRQPGAADAGRQGHANAGLPDSSATIGGLAIFGINGFVVGPVIAAMFVAVWAIVAARTRDGALLER